MNAINNVVPAGCKPFKDIFIQNGALHILRGYYDERGALFLQETEEWNDASKK
jgi:hypothetical protein